MHQECILSPIFRHFTLSICYLSGNDLLFGFF